MALEIERKFLVTSDAWRKDADDGLRIRQGYISTDGATRVRLGGSDHAYITIKGKPLDAAALIRPEFEYAIPSQDAEQLLDQLCRGGHVEKTRYSVPYCGYVWEVDVFHGANAGLIMAEVEMKSADETPALPPWVGNEVTADPRFSNATLAREPYAP